MWRGFLAALACLLLSVPSSADMLGPPPGFVGNRASVAPVVTTPHVFKWENHYADTFFAGATGLSIGTTNPAGTCGTFTAGDFLIAVVSVWTNGGAAPGTISTPTGWTSLINGAESSGPTQNSVFYKIATGSESCSTGFAVTWTTSATLMGWALVDYGGANTATVDNSGSVSQLFTTTSMTAASITLAGATDLLVGVWGNTGANQPYAAPGGMTQRVNTVGTGAASSCDIIIADVQLVSSGATAAFTATAGVAFESGTAGLVGIKP
jgi:hypothetical protein